MRDAKPQCCGFANSQPSHGASVRQPGSANAAAVRAGHVGLLYPMVVASVCFVIGALLLPETNGVDVMSGESTAGGSNSR
jgi:hypothetical protein